MGTLADRLKIALEQSDATQADLADACGVTPSAVSQWVNGYTQNMKMAHIFAAADRLGVRDRWLAMESGPMKETRWTPVAREIADYVSTLPERRQHGIREGFGLPGEHDPEHPSYKAS